MINPNIKIPVSISIEEQYFHCECCGGFTDKKALVNIGGEEHNFFQDGHFGYGNWTHDQNLYIEIIKNLGYSVIYSVQYVENKDPENTHGYFEELFSEFNDIQGYNIRIHEIQKRFEIPDLLELDGFFIFEGPEKLIIDFPNGEAIEITAKENEMVDDFEQVLKLILNNICHLSES